MADLIDACLSKDPEQRPTARHLVEVLSDASAAGAPSLRRSSSQVHGLLSKVTVARGKQQPTDWTTPVLGHPSLSSLGMSSGDVCCCRE